MDYETPPPAGTRFTVDLDDTPPETESTPTFPASLTNGLISDIAERTISSPAVAPTFDPSKSSTGFPAHTKRKRPSAFRQQRDAAATSRYEPVPRSASTANSGGGGGRMDEMSSIRAENAQMVANMSSQERDAERQELMDSLSPELLQMFLKRASLDDNVETSRPSRVPPEEPAPTPTATPPSSTVPLPPTDAPEGPPSQPPHLSNIPESVFPPSIKVHFPLPPFPPRTPTPTPPLPNSSPTSTKNTSQTSPPIPKN
ncbi:uncharacterized protein DFL_003360 [Arthrobotrys flagrans]|uniref:RPAP1 N-terminal domain-containing protein n=1 Tax=Arthrobotrys flagrans TaxID=97331 RepID=A0A437A1M7_ARTFL|nr:hypothetical protein DFL_003360 [Arthrobotrys flagrans]